MSIPVNVKWGGQKYSLELDVGGDDAAGVFKSQLYSMTGVEPDRQKILVKGGQLKDNTDMTKFGIKPGHTFMMMGTAGEIPKAPVVKQVFLEDMTDEQLAEATQYPSGLTNLGNTCYMNSTLQTLRAIPELRDELQRYSRSTSSGTLMSHGADLTSSLRDLYKSMSSSTEGVTPFSFLSVLRSQFPQFAETTRDGRYKQQDAEECWSQLVQSLKSALKATEADSSFIERFMTGKLLTKMTCDDNPDEDVVESTENFIKLDCHISITTNFMRDGLLAGLQEKIEKRSEQLGRDATYTKKSKISRLPKYLTVHFVRFFWRRDVNKKAKIMRRVGFPFELDATEFCTDELRAKVLPVRDRLRELQKEAEEKERARKKAKIQEPGDEKHAPSIGEELAKAVDPDLAKDTGSNASGLYELTGIITHQGASADGGHYMAWIRHEKDKGKSLTRNKLTQESWWKFNDDKVSVVHQDKIESLSGGGESDSALVLLYSTMES